VSPPPAALSKIRRPVRWRRRFSIPRRFRCTVLVSVGQRNVFGIKFALANCQTAPDLHRQRPKSQGDSFAWGQPWQRLKSKGLPRSIQLAGKNAKKTHTRDQTLMTSATFHRIGLSASSFIIRSDVVLTFGDESFANFPGENGRILSLVLFDFGHDGRCGHFGLGAADDARRSDRTSCHQKVQKKIFNSKSNDMQVGRIICIICTDIVDGMRRLRTEDLGDCSGRMSEELAGDVVGSDAVTREIEDPLRRRCQRRQRRRHHATRRVQITQRTLEVSYS
jgi:hypothetical protein